MNRVGADTQVRPQVGLRRRLMIWKYNRTQWAIIFGAWTLLGLLVTTQDYIGYLGMEKSFSWWAFLLLELPFAYLWAALTLLILRLADRFRIERKHWFRNLVIHLLISAALAVSIRAIHNLIFQLGFNPFNSPITLLNFLRSIFVFFDYYMMIYWIIIIFSHALNYQKQYRDEHVKAAHLIAELAQKQQQVTQAQLQALKMQLNPHFLFNTLNAIAALQLTNIDAANSMLTRLGSFLRLTLDNSGAQEVSLQKELEFLNCYLEIEHIRFQDRLAVNMQIEQQTLDARVPNLLLQPIVENAIRHGIARQPGLGRISIRADRRGDMLHLQVADNGPGLDEGGRNGVKIKEGLGLSNTRARLEQLYGQRYRFELRNRDEGGAEADLEIPFELADCEGEQVEGIWKWKVDGIYGL
jgi:two-component system, LytTR family, sensor kinase